MKKRTAYESGGEEPSLTRTAASLPYGIIILIDIDDMKEVVRERGWSQYSPNTATGLLSNLIEGFTRKWQAVTIFGLDWSRGTEEAILEIPYIDSASVVDDLIDIMNVLCREAGVSVTIVVVEGPVTGIRSGSRRGAYKSYRRKPKRILEMLKRKGGGFLYINGKIIYTSPCQRI